MKKITFNKAQNVTLCIVCKKNRVPMNRWQIPCKKCRRKAKSQQNVRIGKKIPAAVVEQNGKRIFVDKFGKEVKDHGYDLDRDPRGNIPAGKVKSNSIII